MSDKILQHLITTLVIILLALVYFAGYVAGTLGWFWLFLGLILLYPLIHKLLNV